jgi:hypothetical protein
MFPWLLTPESSSSMANSAVLAAHMLGEGSPGRTGP